MSTDDQMDAQLRDAGQRWRAANPGSTPGVDFDVLSPQTVSGPAASRNRWLVVASAAVLVMAVALGGTWLATNRTHNHPQPVGVGDGSAEPTTWGGLTGTEWTIFDVTTESANSSDSHNASGSSASLHIHSDGTFTGSDGCNSLSGTVQITASTLTFGPVATTEIGCLDSDVTTIATAIDRILQGQVTWSVNNAGQGHDLSINHAGVGSLIYFEAAPPAQPVTDPAKMQGTWELTEYDQTDTSGGSGSATGAGASEGFGDKLVIAADGTFKVENRCYTNAGDIAVESGKATWSNVHLAGSIPCPATPDQKDEQTRNALVDGALAGATTWQIDGNGNLRITKGGTTLVYAPYAQDTGPQVVPSSGVNSS